MTEHADAVIQGIRLYVIVMGCLVAVAGSAQWRRWRTFLPENQLAWLSLAIGNFSVVFGTIDVYAKGIPGGTRTYIGAVAVTFALFAVLHYPLHQLQRWRRARQIIRRHEKGKS